MSVSLYFCCILNFALPSVEIVSATSSKRSSSKVAAKPIACGNTVATPARATPCKASFHQLYALTPNRSIDGAVCRV